MKTRTRLAASRLPRTLALLGIALTLSLLGCGGGSGGLSSLHIFVADQNNNRIVGMSDLSGTNWVTFGIAGNGVNQFSRPAQVVVNTVAAAVSSTGVLIYTVDTGNNRIVTQTDFNGSKWSTFGTQGNGANQFYHPQQIAFDATGRLYVADTGNNRIVRMDNLTGANWVAYGTQGNGVGQFNSPSSVALDSSGNVYVADTGNNRVVEITDITTGAGWTTLGGLAAGSGANQFASPYGVALDAQNRLYIGDTGNNRVVRVDNLTGANWVAYGTLGNNTGQFNGPTGVFVNSTSGILIADTGNSRVVQITDMTGSNYNSIGFPGADVYEFSGPTSVWIH